MTEKLVYDFAEGNKDLKDLLGGKGANLAEMTNLGLPVPPGFTITTEACRDYLVAGVLTARPARGGRRQPATSSRRRWAGRLGDAADPLLVSVRSGAKFSMPGMMETVLNIGLNDESVTASPQQSGDERFAWDSYRRLIQMFGKTVLGRRRRPVRRRARRGTKDDQESSRTSDRRRACRAWSSATRRSSPCARRPTSRRTRASSCSARSRRSSTPGTPTGPCSTAGRSASPATSAPRSTCRRWCSATRASTRAPASRSPATRPPARRGVYGDYLPNAQGEDVVAGIRNTLSLADLEQLDPSRTTS